jgi:RecA/RadA recombinase
MASIDNINEKPKKKPEKSLMERMLGKRGTGEIQYIPGRDDPSEAFYAPTVYYPSGISVIDGILGNGGFGGGRFAEIYGPNRSGKSELIRRITSANLAKYDDSLVFIYDQERAFDEKVVASDPVFANNAGRLSVNFVPNAEALFKKIEDGLTILAKEAKQQKCIYIIDSLAALMTQTSQEAAIGNKAPSGLPHLMSEVLKKLTPLIQETAALVIFVNQMRSNFDLYAEDESPGGQAVKFWCTYRLKMSNSKAFKFNKKSEFPDGLLSHVKTIKNKLAAPLRECDVPLLFSNSWGSPAGMSEIWSVFHTLKDDKRIYVTGSQFKVRDLDVKFDRVEWPMVFSANRDLILGHVQDWSDIILLKKEAPKPGDDDGEEGTGDDL